MAMISLDSVINDYLGESEQSIHKYKKCFDISFRGFENMGIDFFYQIQTVKLPVSATFIVTVPANCLNVIKAGVLNGKGEVIPLYYNNKLTTYADLFPDRIARTQDNTVFNWNLPANGGWWYNYWANGTYTDLFGLPSGAPFVGSYKYDNVNGVILLNEDFEFSYLMVECLVSPQEGQEYYLPVFFREALIAWLWWKDKKAINVKRGAVGINRDLKEEFSNARRNAMRQYSPFRIEEAYQASQEFTRMTIRG